MDIINKQHLSNLIECMYGYNVTDIVLPQPDGTKNSINDNRGYSQTWSEEFEELRDADPEHTIHIDGGGMDLYGYKFMLDGQPLCYVTMEYDNGNPEGCALVDDWGIETPTDLVEAWLGNTSLEEYESWEDIVTFARIAGMIPQNNNDD